MTNEWNESELHIVSMSQKVLDDWHRGLQFTGGELKLKEFY